MYIRGIFFMFLNDNYLVIYKIIVDEGRFGIFDRGW